LLAEQGGSIVKGARERSERKNRKESKEKVKRKEKSMVVFSVFIGLLFFCVVFFLVAVLEEIILPFDEDQERKGR